MNDDLFSPKPRNDRSEQPGTGRLEGSALSGGWLARIQQFLSAVPESARQSLTLAVASVWAEVSRQALLRGLNEASPLELDSLARPFAHAITKIDAETVRPLTEALLSAIAETDSEFSAALGQSIQTQTLAASRQAQPVMNKDLLVPVSGFLEYPPAIEIVRLTKVEAVTALYRAHGYAPVNTPSVERLEVLTSKGEEVDKEIYTVDRIARDPLQQGNLRLGLRFDLTVPLARFVARHQNELVFPFKRYQAQSCFRGERPQDGRFREFFQCDVDIIAAGQLPPEADREVAAVGVQAIRAMGVSDFTFRISNRKLIQGVLEQLGIQDGGMVTRILDKQTKIGPEKTQLMLEEAGISADLAAKLRDIFSIQAATGAELIRAIAKHLTPSQLTTTGLQEVSALLDNLQGAAGDSGRVVADLGIIRGLDYYTGSIFEATWEKHRNIGSIGAGGRYDNLTGQFAKKEFPGVGFSLGFSRIFDKMWSSGALNLEVDSQTHVMVARLRDDGGERAREIADKLRARGMNVEVYLSADKLAKQLKYANKLRIPYVVFDIDEQVKDMRSGAQGAVDFDTWTPQL